MVLTTRKALVVPGLLLAAAAGVIGQRFASDANPATRVLGEKTQIQGSGQSSSDANSNSNGKGNGNKTFSISGTATGLYPGGTVQLQLKVSNALNQDMLVKKLSASLVGVTKAVGAPAGTCSPGLTIGTWTGSSFTLPKNTANLTAPGSIAVTMSKNANDACQGATVNLKYAGSADQK